MGPKAIIPSRALAKLNFRLVPHQDPAEIEQLVRSHLARLTPFTLRSTTKTYVKAKPVLVNRHHRFIKVAAAACEKAFGAAPVFVRSGGTIPPVADFQHTLNIPIALIGFGLPDDQIHAPNERFHLPNFQKGIASCILLMHAVAHESAFDSRVQVLHLESGQCRNAVASGHS